MTVDARTDNLNLPKNSPSNTLKDDMTRAIAAMDALDTTIFALQTSVAAKANLGHSHTIADITGLQSSLDGKSGTGHTHSLGSLSDVNANGASQGMVLVRGASGWQASAINLTNVGGLSDYGRAFVAQADAAAARTSLGLGSAALLTSSDFAAAAATSDALSKRLRFDAAQELAAPQQTQARANLGMPNVLTDIAAMSERRVRFREVTDLPVTGLNIELSATAKRFRLRVSARYAAVNADIGLRFSFDNGANYRSDNVYEISRLYHLGGAVGGDTITYPMAYFGGLHSSAPNLPSIMNAEFQPGSSNEWPILQGTFGGVHSSAGNNFVNTFRANYPNLARVTHIQLLASASNGLGIGTKFWVEEVL